MTLAIFRAHLRMGLRSLWPWVALLPPLAAVLFVGYHSDGLAKFANTMQLMALALFVFVQMLGTVALTQQGRRQGAGELFDSLPVEPAAWVVGRFAAQYLLWLGAATLLWAAGVAQQALQHHVAITPFAFRIWWQLIPVTLLITTAVAFLLGSMSKGGFSAYILSLLIAFAGSWSGLQGVSGVTMDVLQIGPPTFFDYSTGHAFPLNPLGTFPNQMLLTYNRWLMVAAAVLCISFLVWRAAGQRRAAVARRWAKAVGFAALVVLWVAYFVVRQIGHQRLDAMRAEADAYANVTVAAVGELPAPSVSRYAVDLALKPSESSLAAKATMDLDGPGEISAFTLNQALAVDGVTGPDGSPVPFARDGDFLLITTAGRTGAYTVAYHGRIEQWRLDMWAGIRLAAHIYPQSVMLPANIAWYPLPGAQSLAEVSGPRKTVRDTGAGHPAVPFELRINPLQRLTMVTNANEGPVIGAWLIGTPLKPQSMWAVQVLVEPDGTKAARGLVGGTLGEMEFYNRLIPRTGTVKIVQVPDSLWSVWGRFPTDGFPGAIVLTGDTLEGMGGDQQLAQVLSLWWGMPRTTQEGQVKDVLAQFMEDLYVSTSGQQLGVRLLGMSRFYPSGTTLPEGKSLLEALHGYQERHGLDASAQLLRELHDSKQPLTWQGVAQGLGVGR